MSWPLATVTGLLGASYLYVRRCQSKETSHPPFAPGRLPIIGHLLQVMQPVILQELFKVWSLAVGPVFTVQFGSKHWVVLNSIDAVKDLVIGRGGIYSSRNLPSVLVNDLMYGEERGGGFAFYPYGKYWRKLRRIAHSGLVKQKVQLYQPILTERRDALLSNIRECANDRQPIYVQRLIEHFTLTTILSIVFGDLCSFDPNDPKLHEAFELTEQVASIFGPLEQLRDFFPAVGGLFPSQQQKFTDIRERSANFYGGILEDFKKKMEEDADSVQNCFIQQVLASGELDDMQINNFVSLFVGAGSETTATTISWAIALLANHPDVQEKAFQEIVDHVGTNRLPDDNDIPSLPYIQCIIQETLRLKPPAPLAVPHATSVDDVYNGWFIPKGTTVVLNLHAIHQDPVRYKDPSQFNPDRHMESVQKILTNDRFGQLVEDRPHMAFSTGRRGCVGIHLAERTLFMAIAGLMTSFVFQCPDNQPIDTHTPKDIRSATYAPKPFKVLVIPRSG